MKNIIYKNYIQKKYLNKNKEKKLNISYKKIIYEVIKGLDDNLKNTFYVLNDLFKLNFDVRDLKKFTAVFKCLPISLAFSCPICLIPNE